MNMFILEFGVNYLFGPYALGEAGGKQNALRNCEAFDWRQVHLPG